MKRVVVLSRYAIGSALAISLLCGATEALAEEAAPDAKNQVVKEMTASYERYLRPLLLAELEFIRQHCELPKAARPNVRDAGESALKDAALKYAQAHRVRQGPNRPTGKLQPDAGAIIRQKLNAILTEVLPEKQSAAYLKMVAARDEFRKEAAIRATVVVLDGVLWLSSEQRDKISASIASKWKVNWEPWVSIVKFDHIYQPSIPDELVVPHLDEEQRIVWQSGQRLDLSGQVQHDHVIPFDDLWWEGETPSSAKVNASLEADPAAKE